MYWNVPTRPRSSSTSFGRSISARHQAVASTVRAPSSRPSKYLTHIGQGAAVEVAEVVGQVGVVDLGEPLERELAVAAERALAHEVVAERLGRELLDDLHRLDDVAQRLAHLLDRAARLVLAVDEPVGEDLSRQRQPGRHQHRRPQGAVEPGDVLADDVDVRRPVGPESLVVGAVADGGDVVQQGVEPDVDRLLLVERDRDSPGEPLAADRDVLEAGLTRLDDLVAAALGLDELGVGLVVGEQAVAERGEAEEVVLLLDDPQRRVRVVRAAPAAGLDLLDRLELAAVGGDGLLGGLELLAALAVQALVRRLVDVAGVVNRLDELSGSRRGAAPRWSG